MDTETSNALEKSIKKWEKKLEIESPMAVDLSPDGCPLCDIYFKSNCCGCPVAEKTEKSGCSDSPYINVENARNAYKLAACHEQDQAREEFRKHVKEEIEFHKSLRPEGSQ